MFIASFTRVVAVVGFSSLALLANGATEYFADAVNGNDAYDGTAETWQGGTVGPKKTAQAAVALAVVGSTKADRNTVTLLPGDYDAGETAVTSGDVVSSNRVVITAPILLRSKNGRASRDTTRLVGRWDLSGESDTKFNLGPRAVRCVWVEADALDGTRLEGLTFYRGAAAYGGDGSDHTHSTGGGGVVFNTYNNQQGLVVDCAFVECIGTRGGGLYNGTAVRCLFTRCRASVYGQGARQCAAYNCVFDGNLQCTGAGSGGAKGVGVLAYPRRTVNCTFVGNAFCAFEGHADGDCNGPILNCLFLANGNAEIGSGFVVSNSVMPSVGSHDSCVQGTETELFSPATGDWRLTAGAAAMTAADAAFVAQHIPEEFRATDYLGNPRANADGTVYAGAVQATAVPAGGRLVAKNQITYDISGMIVCDGHVCACGNLYEQGETWPRSRRFSRWPTPLTDAVNRGLLSFMRDESRQWPLRDDTSWFVAPAAESQNEIYFTTAPYVYVDPVLGSDDATTNDGSTNKPWRTLQKAVTRANADDAAIVIAASGDYSEGATFYSGCSNRVYVSTPAPLRVKGAGAETTFITGAPDEVSPIGDSGYGLGTNAVRCVAIDSGACCAFQGFTLRGGRGSRNANDSDCAGARGAGFLNGGAGGGYGTGWLLDSVVTNCYGSRGPGAYGGRSERTLFTHCRGNRYAVLRYVTLISCVVRDTDKAYGGVAIAGDVYNTTFYGNTDSTKTLGDVNSYNCIAYGNKTDLTTMGKAYRNCLVWNMSSGCVLPETCVQDNAYFTDAAGGDLRLVSGSPATWLGSVNYLKSAMDFTGHPFTFGPDGSVRAGAIDELTPGVRIESACGVKTAAEVRAVPEGGLTVTDATWNGRPCQSMIVNGVTQGVSTVSVTVTPTESLATVPYLIAFAYPTHFYVDVTNGSNSASGFSPEAAWKTLAYASTNATFSGDIVTVLPGVYDEDGIVVPRSLNNDSVEAKLLTRVVVREGVTFESRDGAASTIVMGASATGTLGVDCDATGYGTNAVKCAFICDNATLRGFTLRGGRTSQGAYAPQWNDPQWCDFRGAGVLGPAVSVSELRTKCHTRVCADCVIDDCRAPRGGASYFVTLSNCVVRSCGGINMGSVVRNGLMYNCLITKSVSGGSHYFYDLGLYGCTFLADNEVATVTYSATPPFGSNVVNCAFCKAASVTAIAFTNCAFASGMKLSRSSNADFSNVNPVLNITDFKLDADGRPLAGSPLLDAGAREYAAGETDCGGGQRVYNGVLDIGAYEYDVRGDFAKELAKRRLVITALDADATTNAAHQVVLAKGTLAATWTSRTETIAAPYSFVAQVTGTGTLTVTRDGVAEPLATLTAGAAQTFEFTSPEEVTRLVFAYAPGADDTGAALLGSFTHSGGMTIFIE